jgi:hypothetical protein
MDSLIKPDNDRRASFGRHETFSLRYAWLTKGFQAFMKKKTIFSSDEATIELGVGKNRVNAIKLLAQCWFNTLPINGSYGFGLYEIVL